MNYIAIFLVLLALFVQFYEGLFAQKNKSKHDEESIRKVLVEKREKLNISDEERQAFSFKEEPEVIAKSKYVPSQDMITIPINSPVPLSYKTKKEIYELRKKYVQNSIFADPNYEPSEAVFGQIIDNKPWVSMKLCQYESTHKSDIEGPSEESRFINNPALLVAPEYAFYGYPCEEKARRNNNNNETPISIKYYKNKNELVVTYKKLMFCNIPKVDTWFALKGLNARDLGYKYAYVDKSKSTFNFKFKEEYNASNHVVEFQDFIHLGGSCRHEGGCNNGSPNQPPLNFVYPCPKGEGKFVQNKIIYIKLWKERPSSPQQKADIVEKLVIRDSWTE